MTTLALPRAALRALLMRAAILWVLLRLFIVAATTFSESDASNPVGVVVLCTLLGVIDIRRRREVALWGNLGLSATQLVSLFALVAVLGELLLFALGPAVGQLLLYASGR